MNKVFTRDSIERVLAVAFVSTMVWRIFGEVLKGAAVWVSLLVCFGEVLVLFFLLIRRPSEKVSASWSEWALAFAATILPTLVNGGAIRWSRLGWRRSCSWSRRWRSSRLSSA